MKLYWQRGYIVIEEDHLGQANEFLINEVINEILKKRKLITRDIKRCVRKDNYLVICPYGSLSGYSLLHLVERLIKDNSYNIDFYIPNEVEEKLENFIPIPSDYDGSTSSGATEDSKEVDENVKCLVEVMNMFDGVNTFSSCEGHPPQGNLYVCFDCDSIPNLNRIAYYFDKYLSVVWYKYGIDTVNYKAQLIFKYGKWPHRPGVFFEFRFNYDYSKKNVVFEAVKEMSCLIKEELLKETYVNTCQSG